MHFRQTYNEAPSKLAVIDIETIAPSTADGSFPPWAKHRPIVASVLTADQVNYGQWRFSITSVTFEDERAAIARIDELLHNRTCIGFNSRGFDLPILAVTASRCFMFEASNLRDAWTSKRYDRGHIDVADFVSGYGAAPRVSLEMLCEALGIPVKTMGHGGDVAEMLREKGIESVARYCEEDVASTLVVFAMVQALRSVDTGYAASLLCDLVNWIADAGHEHLAAFRKLSSHAVLQQARLLHRLDEGIMALDDRARTAFFEGDGAQPLKQAKTR